MDDALLMSALRAEASRVAALSGDEDSVSQPVAACPGWTVGRLIGHLSRVHRWATALLQADPPRFFTAAELDEQAPRDATVFDWYRAGLAPLYAELQREDLDRPVFTWAGEQTRRWWLRRLAHETAVHRFDAQQALSAPAPVEPAAAADGISELFDLFVPHSFDTAAFAADGHDGQTMHLHCTDVEGEWLARFTPDDVVVERVHAKGDVAVRGGASDLFLVLWNRLPVDRCEVFGDVELFEAFLDTAAF